MARPRSRFLLLALLCLTVPTAAHADKRVALVIGNSAYKSTPLNNPKNDAELMAETLHGVGFTLVGGRALLDLDGGKFRDAVKEFGKELKGADVGLFYYAGHGAQVRGQNYLIPIDATDVDLDMIDVNAVLRQMQVRLNMVILDACRNDAFGSFTVAARAGDTTLTRDWKAGGGLAEMTAPPGTLIAFAAQPNKVAQDGAGRDSPFTAALAEAMREPGLDLTAIFSRVQAEVYDKTNHQQTPYYVSIIIPTFYFTGPTDTQNRGMRGSPTPLVAGGPNEAERAWVLVKETTSPAVLEDFIRRFGDSFYATVARERLEELKKKSQVAVVALPAPVMQAPVPAAPTHPAVTALAPSPSGHPDPRMETVRAFYSALSSADGNRAASLVVPEKRANGPLSASAVTKYYSSLSKPLQLIGLVFLGDNRYQADYSYGAGTRSCHGSAVLTVVERNGSTYVEQIRASPDSCS